MKTFPEVFDTFRVTWKYAIKKYNHSWKLVELYKGKSLNGAYSIVLDGGESRSDIVGTLQLAVLDTFTNKEMEQLQNMWAFRKDVKKKRG